MKAGSSLIVGKTKRGLQHQVSCSLLKPIKRIEHLRLPAFRPLFNMFLTDLETVN